jgi:hypothetical protein
MRDSLELFLSREQLAGIPFLDSQAVIAQKNRHLTGGADLGFELWGIMALSAWWRHHTQRPKLARVERADMKRITLPVIRRGCTAA